MSFLRVSHNAMPLIEGEEWRDELIVLLSTIFIFRKLRRKQTAEVSASVLSQLFGNNYMQIVNRAIDLGLIKESERYIVGRKSKEVAILSPYNVDLLCPEFTNKKLLRRLEKMKKNTAIRNKTLERFTRRNLARLSLDLDAIDFDLAINEDNPDMTPEILTDIRYDIAHFSHDQDDRWDYIIRGKNSGRLFTPLNNLNGNLRKYATVEGQSLRELDIKNSQPYFLIAEYDNVKTRDMSWFLERKKYIKDVTATEPNNSFYEIINGGSFKNNVERNKYKKDLLTALYAEQHVCNHLPIWHAIKARYPILAARMMEIKQPDYRNLPRGLQTRESNVMVKKILTYIAEKRKSFFLLGTHDGFLFIDTPENEKYLREMIIAECTKQVGVAPIVTSKAVRPSRYWEFRNAKQTKILDSAAA